MDAALEPMGNQLDDWVVKIEERTARYTKPGARLRFDVVMYLDELKGLYAVARSELDAYLGAGGEERTRRAHGLQIAWDELAVAMERRPPHWTPGR